MVKFTLVNHRYSKGIQAIHQCMSLGILRLIKAVVAMGADVNATMHDEMSVMHCAA
jgi:hypothetical protein